MELLPGQERSARYPSFWWIGIEPDGVKEVLGFSVGDGENQAAWEQRFKNLKERGGVKEVGLLVTDGNQAMLNALAVKFPVSSGSDQNSKEKAEHVALAFCERSTGGSTLRLWRARSETMRLACLLQLLA